MIRLNDINKTVIDEKTIKGYGAFTDSFYDRDKYKDVECISLFTWNNSVKADYESKESRDKDIELLDKLFDVKNIEDKANEESKPSYDFGEPQVLEPEPNYVLGDSQECEPKKEEYITWEEVKNSKKRINIKFSNGDIHSVDWDEGNLRIQFFIGYDYEGCIYEEDLFNALMLKKVE